MSAPVAAVGKERLLEGFIGVGMDPCLKLVTCQAYIESAWKRARFFSIAEYVGCSSFIVTWSFCRDALQRTRLATNKYLGSGDHREPGQL